MRSPMQSLRRAAVAISCLAVVSGCSLPPQDAPGSTDAGTPSLADSGAVTPMTGFSWVHDHRFAAMPRPGARRLLSTDMNFLREQGIRFLVSLTLSPTDLAQARAAGIVVHHIPVADFTAPTQAQIREFVFVMDAFLTAGERVGVHCTAGLGRSGTMVATYFVSLGMSARQAITQIRLLRPGSIETVSQEQSIYEYAACPCRVPGQLSPQAQPQRCRCNLEDKLPTTVD